MLSGIIAEVCQRLKESWQCRQSKHAEIAEDEPHSMEVDDQLPAMTVTLEQMLDNLKGEI